MNFLGNIDLENNLKEYVMSRHSTLIDYTIPPFVPSNINHYMYLLKKYINIKYNYTSILNLINHNDYLNTSDKSDYLFINDLQNG